MKTETYEFHTDPGHGWLKVPIKRIEELGITKQISSYSYKKNEFAYLEEDCDAGLFLQALKSVGIQLKTTEINTDNESVIRNYRRFKD